MCWRIILSGCDLGGGGSRELRDKDKTSKGKNRRREGKIIELYNLEKMNRTIPLAMSPKMPMIETIKPMTTNTFDGKFSMRISCSLVQNGSSPSRSSSSSTSAMLMAVVVAVSNKVESLLLLGSMPITLRCVEFFQSVWFDNRRCVVAYRLLGFIPVCVV